MIAYTLLLSALTLLLPAVPRSGPVAIRRRCPSRSTIRSRHNRQTAEADGVAQKLAAGARPVPEWWTAYQSDELNELVEEGLKNSPSLAAAQSTLKAAREQLRSQIGRQRAPESRR